LLKDCVEEDSAILTRSDDIWFATLLNSSVSMSDIESGSENFIQYNSDVPSEKTISMCMRCFANIDGVADAD
jgi:hypothetical protein